MLIIVWVNQGAGISETERVLSVSLLIYLFLVKQSLEEGYRSPPFLFQEK